MLPLVQLLAYPWFQQRTSFVQESFQGRIVIVSYLQLQSSIVPICLCRAISSGCCFTAAIVPSSSRTCALSEATCWRAACTSATTICNCCADSMLSSQKAGVQESITSMTLAEITKERNRVFHIALASFALLSFRVKEKLASLTSSSSSLTKLEARDFALGESTSRRTDHNVITPLRLVHQRLMHARTQLLLVEQCMPCLQWLHHLHFGE